MQTSHLSSDLQAAYHGPDSWQPACPEGPLGSPDLQVSATLMVRLQTLAAAGGVTSVAGAEASLVAGDPSGVAAAADVSV